MKKTTGNKTRLGIFVTIAFLLFIGGIYLIGQKQNLFSRTFHVSGVFKDVSGLQVGNNVRFSGINVGIIENIQQVSDSTVKVDMVINQGTRKFIKKNAKAIIGSDGLMGNKIMLIIPGIPGAKEIADNDMIATSQPVSMDDILLDLKTAGENAALISDDLAAITETIRSGKGTIGKLFMDTIFAEHIDQTIRNLEHGTKGFGESMEAVKSSFLLRGSIRRNERKEAKAEEKE